MSISEKSRVTNVFSDIDLDFIPHPISGDISPLQNSDSVKRAVRNLLLTGLYERPFSPDLGANLKQLLFEPVTPLSQLSIKNLVLDVIRIHEPRVSVVELQVSVSSDEQGYDLHLMFAIDNLSEVSTVEVFLERLR